MAVPSPTEINAALIHALAMVTVQLATANADHVALQTKLKTTELTAQPIYFILYCLKQCISTPATAIAGPMDMISLSLTQTLPVAQTQPAEGSNQS